MPFDWGRIGGPYQVNDPGSSLLKNIGTAVSNSARWLGNQVGKGIAWMANSRVGQFVRAHPKFGASIAALGVLAAIAAHHNAKDSQRLEELLIKQGVEDASGLTPLGNGLFPGS